jgi:hypothetical protein
MKSKYFAGVATTLIFVMSFTAQHASAQLIVTDPVQEGTAAAQEVTAASQLAKAVEGVEIAQKTLDAVGSGVTPFSSMSFDTFDDRVPVNPQDALNVAKSSGPVGISAQAIIKSGSKLDAPGFSRINSLAKGNFTDEMSRAAGAEAAAEEVYASVPRHEDRIKDLQRQLMTTTDLKQSADLSSKISIEDALLVNEFVKLMALQMMNDNAAKGDDISRRQGTLIQKAY